MTMKNLEISENQEKKCLPIQLVDEIQLFYDLGTINIISSSPADQIKKLDWTHMAPGP